MKKLLVTWIILVILILSNSHSIGDIKELDNGKLVIFSPDKKWVIIENKQQGEGILKLWDLK